MIHAHATESMIVKELQAWEPAELEKIYAGENPQAAIYFSKGSLFPLELFYTGDFFTLIAPQTQTYQLVISRDFWLRVPSKEEFVCSLDGDSWEPLFDMVSGQLTFGFSLDETMSKAVFSGFLKEIARSQKQGEAVR